MQGALASPIPVVMPHAAICPLSQGDRALDSAGSHLHKTWAWALCALIAENSLSVASALQVVDKHTMVTKHTLHATSGSLVPGEMMALVGPSGAGGHPSACIFCCVKHWSSVLKQAPPSLDAPP